MSCHNCSDLRPGLDSDQLRIADFERDLKADYLNPRETVHLAAEAAEHLIAAGQAAADWKRGVALA